MTNEKVVFILQNIFSQDIHNICLVGPGMVAEYFENSQNFIDTSTTYASK